MNNYAKLFLCSVFIYMQTAIAAELDTHNEQFDKAECNQWSHNIQKREKIIKQLGQKLKNAQDTISRKEVLNKIGTVTEQKSNIEKNFEQECGKFNIK